MTNSAALPNGIEPGIYRVSNLPFDIVGNAAIDTQVEIISVLDKIKNQDSDLHSNSKVFNRKMFFSTPQDFLDTWIKGYQEDEEQLQKASPLKQRLGFELYYTNLDVESDFYEIPTDNPHFPHTGTEFEGRRINPIMLCADGNGLYDQYGFMNLGINDLRTSEVLIHRGRGDALRGEENIPYSDAGNPLFAKPLRNDQKYYNFDGKERFPFSSSNKLKAYQYAWHMVGISPLEVYAKLENLGFVWPEKSI